MEVRSAVAKSACSPVLPVSDSTSGQNSWVSPQILQNPFVLRTALQEAERFLTTKCLRPEDASPEMLSAEGVTTFFRQIVRLLTLADISQRNVLVSQRLNYALAN